MMKLLIGTYTTGTASEGVYEAALDVRTGALSHLRAVGSVPDPSYLISTGEGRIYAVCESPAFHGKPGGGVMSLLRLPDGRLVSDGALPSGGQAPCHLAIGEAGTRLAVANYGDGVLSVFSLAPDGALREQAASFVYTAKGANAARQECAHAHFAAFACGEILCCDLGGDCIRRYDARTLDSLAPVRLPAGCGPRHLLRRPGGALYVVSELTSELFTLMPDGRGGCELIDVQSCLPQGAGESWAAALREGEDGRLFVSNRGHDSVAVFRLGADGIPIREGVYPCGGRYPRDILPVGEGLMLCACQNADEVTCLREEAGGWSVVSRLAVPAPVCLLRVE